MKKTDESINEMRSMLKELSMGQKEMQKQIGQISSSVSNRAAGSLPSDTEKNPKETCNAVALRSRKVLERKQKDEEIVPCPAPPQRRDDDSAGAPGSAGAEPHDTAGAAPHSASNDANFSSTSPSPYKVALPFPQAQRKCVTKDKSFLRILEILKGIHINIPFIDAILQMPNYARYFKDMLSNKRKWEGNETVNLTEECSAIFLSKLPRKLKDPGSLLIPCTIGDLKFERVLCDNGASINLMPYSIFKKLGLGEPKPTSIILELADCSIKRPKGIIEDVIVQVDRFMFPVDFVVLDLDEESDTPIILGRPFLATGNAVIKVAERKLTLSVGNESTTFEVYKVSNETDHYFQVEEVDLFTGKASEEKEKGIASELAHDDVKDLTRRDPAPTPMEDPPKPAFKISSSNRKCLRFNDKLPVIVSSLLSAEQETRLKRVLEEDKGALDRKDVDIQGISPKMSMPRSRGKAGAKSIKSHKWRKKKRIEEVVKEEVLKLLDTILDKQISRKSWDDRTGVMSYNEVKMSRDKSSTRVHDPN